MSILKKAFGISAAACVCMGMSACSTGSGNSDSDIVGDDWRVTGVVRDSGTITRNGEDTNVLVSVLTEGAAFYYDTKDQLMFDTVFYPTELAQKVALSGDVWGMYKSIDFADLNGDGNSDVTMKFDDSGSELVIVWFWDTENIRFEYQPNESTLPGAEESAQTDILYAVFGADNVKEYPIEYTGAKKTAEELANALTELTGLDFIITASKTEDGWMVDWAADSTLIAGPGDREQKEHSCNS